MAQSIRWAPSRSVGMCHAPFQAAPGVYVAAAYHNGGLIPGVVTANNICLIPFGGGAVSKTDYFLLSNPGNEELVWQSASRGNIPIGALQGGYSETGEPLYIGRYRPNRTFVTGKVHPSHKVCYVPHMGREISNASYDVLCLKTIPLASLGLQ